MPQLGCVGNKIQNEGAPRHSDVVNNYWMMFLCLIRVNQADRITEKCVST